MTDEEKLEAITSCVIHGMIQYPMTDLSKYQHLAERVANLVEVEMEFQANRNHQRQIMACWGPQRN